MAVETGATRVVMPAMGDSVAEGTVLEGHKQVGDRGAVDEISTDKVDMELPAPTSGTLTEILADEGETVTVGQVIGRMAAGAPAGLTQPARGSQPPAAPVDQGAPAQAPAAGAPQSPADD